MVDTNTYLERNIGRKEKMNVALKERRKVLFALLWKLFILNLSDESKEWGEERSRARICALVAIKIHEITFRSLNILQTFCILRLSEIFFAPRLQS